MSAPMQPEPPHRAAVAAVSGEPKLLRPTRRRRRSRSLERQRARRLRSLRLPLRILMLLAIAATLVLARSLLIPLVLAAFIALGLNPIVAGLHRVHVPRAIGSVLVMLALGTALVGTVSALSTPAAQWIHEAPSLVHEIGYKLRRMARPLTRVSNAASQSLADIGVGASPGGQAAQGGFSLGSLLRAAPSASGENPTVALLVFFFLTYGHQMRTRLVTASPAFSYRRVALRLVRGIQQEVSRYLLTVTVINVCLGFATAGILWAFKMPDPMMWGGVATLLNFMPYLGAITNTLLLAVVGLLTFSAPAHALLPALCFAALAMLEGNVITPMIMGNRMRLSPLAIVVWLLLWGWMWGIPGALLAVPMLTCVKLITEWLPGWQWFARMVEH
jgi:predicted PurR-regulated permease PerM